jgi:hypothetical protein
MMKPAKKTTKKPESQSAAFCKAARELGCDESEERFQEALRKLSKKQSDHKPTPPTNKRT